MAMARRAGVLPEFSTFHEVGVATVPSEYCSGDSRAISVQRRCGETITLAEKLIAMRHVIPRVLHRTFDGVAVDRGFRQDVRRVRR